MTISAVALAAAGAALLFAPAELQRVLSGAGSAAAGAESMSPLMMQLWAAALLGLASMSWIGRGMTLGGVYGRALVLANLAHWTVGGLSMVRAVLDRPSGAGLWLAAAVYVAFALAFAWLMRRDPVPR